MSDFALPPDVEHLRETVARFAERELAPAAREAEASGRWSDAVLGVIDGFALRGLDLPASLDGEEIGSLAKVAILEALAYGDAGGLPAADTIGMSAGAVVACPDAAVASEVAALCLAGDARCALVVVDAQTSGPPRIEWSPAWPTLRWVWVSEGDELALLEAGDVAEAKALAFQASGGVSALIDRRRPVGKWRLETGAGLLVRGRARLWTSAVAVGIAQAAFDATVAYTTDRMVFGKAVAHHQGNAFELAVAATNIHGARLAVHDAAWRIDDGDPYAGYWATQAWLTTIDTAAGITDLGIQLLGGHGFLVDHLAEKRFREVGMLRLLTSGRDGAEADVSQDVLDVPDPVFA